MNKFTAWFLIGIVYIFVLLSFIGMAKADTELRYQVCSVHSCTTYSLWGSNEDFFQCKMKGPVIISQDMAQRGLLHHYLRRWWCILAPPSQDL